MIAARRPYGLVFPIVLVLGGLLILLANMGTLPSDSGWRLLQLWPLLLVMVGVELLVPHLFRGAAVPLVTLLLVGAIALGGFAYAVAGASLTSGTYTRVQSTLPRADVSTGSVTIDAAGAEVNIRAGDSGDQLYQAKVDYAGSAPRFSYSDGKIHISTNQNGFLIWNRRQDIIDLTLNRSVDWTVDVNGAGISAKIDFTQGKLHSFAYDGVGGNVTLLAGAPVGVVSVNVSGVGTGVTVNVPSGTAYHATASGIGTNVDGTTQTPGWEAATDRYEVSANGVGAHVTVAATD